jgi:ketosteroid isomerase-like protein
MQRLFIALAVAVLAAGPAAATDKTDVMALMNHWVDAFNQGDTQSMVATCADEAAIIDDFAPHEWHGAGTCAKWLNDFELFAKAGAFSDLGITIGKPWHIDATADYGYVVAPATFSFKQKGKPVTEHAVLTVSLKKSAAGWRITGWSWADH